MLDKVSIKLLKALYKKDLPEEEVNRIIERTDKRQPDKRLSFLETEKMISRHMITGASDGEGGYIDETVKWSFHLEPNGRAVVEDERKHLLEKILDLGSNILP